MATIKTNTAARRLRKEEPMHSIALSSSRGFAEPVYTVHLRLRRQDAAVAVQLTHTEFADLLQRGVHMVARWQGTGPEGVV